MALPYMEVPFVDLVRQYRTIQQDIDAAIQHSILQADFIGGETVRAFEKAFAQAMGVSHGVAVANGTDAIEIVLQACGIGAGDEVIVPAHSWISTSEAVTTIGATPVFVDTLPHNYTMDPAAIEAAITPRTKAIIPVHLTGMMANMTAIQAIAERHGLLVFEDCAQAHLATHQGHVAGSMGKASTFSFYPGKNLGAYGDAGAILTHDADLAERCRIIANHGQKTKHQHLIQGRNSRLDALQAGILLAKLPHLEFWTQERNRVAAEYRKQLAGTTYGLQHVPDGQRHVYHLFVIETDRREALMDFLKQRGIQTAIHYPKGLPFLDCYPTPADNAYPVVRIYQDRILSLPIFPEMTQEEITYVCDALKDFLA
jgi:dTDP-4-amino-4,6-dideoxygalactose transaminase